MTDPYVEIKEKKYAVHPEVAKEISKLRQSREDADILFGYNWQQALHRVQGDPEKATQQQLTKIVGDLAEANDNHDKTIKVLENLIKASKKTEVYVKEIVETLQEESGHAGHQSPDSACDLSCMDAVRSCNDLSSLQRAIAEAEEEIARQRMEISENLASSA